LRQHSRYNILYKKKKNASMMTALRKKKTSYIK
jgi:hypothetical protein